MATPLNPDTVYEIVISGTYLGQDAINVMHFYQEDTEGAGQDLEAFLSELRDIWRANFLPLMSEEYSVVLYEAKVIDELLGTTALNAHFQYGGSTFFPGEAADVGGGVGAELPSNVAVTFKKSMGSIGTIEYLPDTPATPNTKKLKGSMRLAAQLEDNTKSPQGNFWEDAHLAALALAADALAQIVVGVAPDRAQLQMVILSAVNNNAIRRNAGNTLNVFAYAPVESFAPNSWVGSQNSRKYTGPS